MKKKLTFIMILVVLALTSCSDFLDKYDKYHYKSQFLFHLDRKSVV